MDQYVINALVAAAALAPWLFTRAKLNKFMEKYGGIIAVDEEITSRRAEADKVLRDIDELKANYVKKREMLVSLEHKVAVYDDKLAFAEMGIYEPQFSFEHSDEYKAAIEANREEQKAMVKNKTAVATALKWHVEGSAKKGEVMINRQIRLTLRALNSECDAAIAKVTWSNANAMLDRIARAVEALDRENTTMGIQISPKYHALKKAELRLTHEWAEKKRQEKDARAELARAEREEKKLLADAEAAERDEQKYQALLEKARKQADTESNRARIAELEAALTAATEASVRARAMAELTRCGYIYIISNVGAFGEDVVKIGMTRRIDPDDRVRELGDASVPFGFDTHAMIYSEDAPGLEAALHKEFDTQRVNASNLRKEFFRASLDEVEAAVTRLAPGVTFFKDRDAQEWHETLARRNLTLQTKLAAASSEFPATLED